MKKDSEMRTKEMLHLVPHRLSERVLFTDEKIFTVKLIHKSENNRQLLKRVCKNTFSPKVMTKQHFSKCAMVYSVQLEIILPLR